MSVDAHTENKVGSKADRKLLGRLMVFARPHVTALCVTVLMLMANVLLRLIGPWIIAQVIDGPVETARVAKLDDTLTPALTDSLVSEVLNWGWVFLGTAFFLAANAVFLEWLMNRTGQNVVLTVRNVLFHHLLRLPVGWFDKHHVGWVVTRSTSDVDSLSELFTTGVATIAKDILSIIVLLGALFWLSPSLSLVAVFVLPVMIFVSFRFRLKARMAYRATRQSLSRVNAFLQERLTGLDVVHLFRRERASAVGFGERNERYYRDNMVTVRHFSLFFPTVDVLSQVVKLGTLTWGAALIFSGDLELGVFIQYWLYLEFIFEPIRELAERYNVLQAGIAAGERIFGILDAPTENGKQDLEQIVADTAAEAERTEPLVTLAQAREKDQSGPAIRFDNVSFAYGDGPDVISNVSFDVQRGQKVAVVGHTGAGKTTLVSLLCRFHDTSRGKVELFGNDVHDLSHAELRRRIAIVQQDVFLFSDDIAANVRMGEPLSDERLHEVARAVNADRFIDPLPDGFATRLLERGSNLSSGQRQLIAFARALAADPDILVLDEATSSVDSETEHWIEEATAALMQGRTSLVIAHRLSTIINADKILVFHKGELREAGTHDELLALKGLYHKLYHLHLASGTGDAAAGTAR
ncbi:MAG: xenobiotic ABC transporter ATP-binding protein [Planctomycetota bacterium]|nr:MAG: xenobiotic ABC transporter ATP-binding protein [Planctomycetota bacterium]